LHAHERLTAPDELADIHRCLGNPSRRLRSHLGRLGRMEAAGGLKRDWLVTPFDNGDSDSDGTGLVSGPRFCGIASVASADDRAGCQKERTGKDSK
jgi:hypothetical protein